MNDHKFKKGNPGKPKGAMAKVNRQAKELFINIMEGEVDNIKNSLDELRTKDKGRYLEVLSKFFPYFIPKKVEIDTPSEITINVKRKH
jgi:hypothetical protein